jgi:hypothetical protein
MKSNKWLLGVGEKILVDIIKTKAGTDDWSLDKTFLLRLHVPYWTVLPEATIS